MLISICKERRKWDGKERTGLGEGKRDIILVESHGWTWLAQ